ncbi:MAG: 3-deoxy-D-manno-octulosonic acid transferase [Candidatus Omnitrophica bacterium]|nr:3-deoxy-D-manno-octulosonic acid transferase [Candidatus Omnitrophota bacterium]
MLILYNILYLIAFVFYLPVLLVKGKLHSGFKQRFGILGQELCYRLFKKPNIWFHAVSVGEILAIVGLVEKMRLRHPQYQIVISTVTKTGYSLAQKCFKKEDVIVYAPVDLSWVVNRFIKKIKPEIFVTAETEIWPNLLLALSKVDIPMAMVNGRISDKSFYRYRRFSGFLRQILRPFRAFCMQSALDADRIISLGAVSDHVSVPGSMKFDDIVIAEKMTAEQLGFNEDSLIWVAGSTHVGEEKIVLDVFKKLKSTFPSLSLIIAPRHIERTEEVHSLVKAIGFVPVNFSDVRAQSLNSDVVIVVDTIGHLKALYQVATVVFVGKSLVGHGGQNIIEPAFFGKPIIIGPNMQNFIEITETFLTARGVIQIQESAEMEDILKKLLSSTQLRETLGERAQAIIKKNQGATDRTEKILSRILATTHFVKPT